MGVGAASHQMTRSPPKACGTLIEVTTNLDVKQPKSKSMPQVIQKTAWITNECVELDQVCFRGKTPREPDWGCQSIPWLLYTIMEYVHVCTESTDTV